VFDYGEFCPISMATNVLCERWTLQIIREMVLGATRYSEFQRHMPKISPSLLKSRLRYLEDEGIVLRKSAPGQRGSTYHLTGKGKAIEPILSELGKWGMYWCHEGITDDQLNIHTLLRDITAGLHLDQLPSGESIIQINLSDRTEQSRYFIRIQDERAELCELDMGHDVDVYLTATLRTFTEVWYGDRSLAGAIESGDLKVVGHAAYTRNVTRWFPISGYTAFNRHFTEGKATGQAVGSAARRPGLRH
jgi:DNA-binding HxlR family transcriptional regulator